MYVLSEEGGATQKAYEDVEGGGGALQRPHVRLCNFQSLITCEGS